MPTVLAAALCVHALSPSSAAASDVIAVQADGKIVVAGGAPPRFGMLARLHPDGSLDRSFGKRGIVIDPHSRPLTEIGLQSDGKIVALDQRNQVKRYHPDGPRDPGFGRGGVVGGGPSDASFMTLFPEGRIGVASYSYSKFGLNMSAAVYAADGRSAVHVDDLSGRRVSALAAGRDGSLLVADGSALDRLLPGADSPYDPSFDGGTGYATGAYPAGSLGFNAIVPTPAGLLAAGGNANHVVLARFSNDGVVDRGFGVNGFAEAPLPSEPSRGNDLAVQSDGKLVVGGDVGGKGDPFFRTCLSCPKSPLLLRFLPDGALDTTFGDRGVARVTGFDGSPVLARGQTVATLLGGRILIGGEASARKTRMIVSRFDQSGALDPSFGDGGVATIEACPGGPAAQRRRGCLPSLRARLRLRRSQQGVTLRWRLSPNLEWGRIKLVEMRLPGPLRFLERRKDEIEATYVEDGSQRQGWVRVVGRSMKIAFENAESLSLTIPASALRVAGEIPPGRKLPFRVKAWFEGFLGVAAGRHEVVLRRAIG
jgi:uncharacterized delta-60 repeat protein